MYLSSMKQCRLCGETKPLSEFYDKGTRCKVCLREKARKYREDNLERVKEYDRNRPNHAQRVSNTRIRYIEKRKSGDVVFLEKDRLRTKNYRERNPQKHKAQRVVNNALRDGLIVRPTTCSCCEKECKPQGHHWSYDEEHWLDVIWLCTRCHADEHKRLRELGLDID